MDKYLQKILDIIQKDKNMSAEEKNDLSKATKDNAKELAKVSSKLKKTEKNHQATSNLLDKKTTELTGKNRELEIEAALDRVRSRAMAMQKTDELLEAGELLYKELSKLGIASLTSGYVLMTEDEKTGWNYLVNPEDGSIMSKPAGVPHTETKVMRAITSSWKKQKTFNIIELDPQETIDHQTFIAERSANFAYSAAELISFSPERLMLQTFNFKQGYLLIVGGLRLSDAELKIMMRFTKVFEMTYRRFLDLQKAETQAREAQIELALERVRARAMAMQNSNELSQLVDKVFKELIKLDFELEMCIINIIDEGDLSNMVWATNPEGGKEPESYYLKFEDYPFHHAMMKAWKERKTKWVYTIAGPEKKVYDAYLFNETEFSRYSKEAQMAYSTLEKYVASFSFSNFGGLQTIGDKPLSDTNLDILARFGKVFDHTYTRFNDLKQAEEQTRETEIELALERVRARTMAMQNSDELPQAANLLFLQVQGLDIPAWSAGYNILAPDKKSSTCWMSSEGVIQKPFDLPFTEESSFSPWLDVIKNKDRFFVQELGGEVLEGHYDYLKTLPTVGETLQEFEKSGIALPTVQVNHLSFFTQGFLLFITYEPVPYAHDIFKRFTAVFEQTYTRFLDLQKAEEQAKEAQIEVALEKVRSRSMAMHKSEELLNVIKVVSEQLLALNFKFDNVSFGQNNQEHDYNFWLSAKGYPEPFQISAPFLDNPVINSLMEAHNNKVSFLTNTFSPKESKEWFQHLIDHGNLTFLPEAAINYILNNSFTRSSAILENIQLFVGRYGIEPYTDNENKIIARFAQVFEQSFTRFLDLQKAEEQAKEAQIETALERVRSRSLGMHKSEELNEVILLLNNEMLTLGVGQDSSLIATDLDLDDPKSGINTWIAAEDTPYYGKYRIPMFDHPLNTNLVNAYNEGITFYTDKFSKEEKDSYYKYIFKNSDFKETSSSRKKKVLNSDGLSRSVVNLKNSVLIVQRYTNEEFSAVQNEIIKRFGFVFEQAYTRFLDLKKAEEQAEEAQIEAGLEKVRSRSLAMHKTEELLEVIMEVFTQFKKLNLDTHACWIDILKKGSNDFNLWIATPEGGYPTSVKIPYIDNPIFNDYIKARKNKALLANSYTKPIKNVLYKHFFKQPALRNAPKERIKFIMDAPGVIFSVSYTDHIGFGMNRYNKIPFSDKENDILIRFTKVFDQSYTRFLDLQKAEAQAREAQIEAALERVRSRTIGMLQSEELQDAAMILFEQVEALGVQTFVSGFNIWEEDKKYATAWMAGKDRLQAPFKTTTAEDIYLPIFEAEQKGEPLFIKEQGGEELVAHYKYLTTIPEVKDIEEEMSRAGVSFPSFQIIHCAFFSKGYLMFISYEPVPEAHDIFRRFAKVFEQTYTRFLDLQKAEDQAKEAVKQSSLDRVRAEIASMRTSTDLERITPLIWKELTALGVTFYRCGVFIIEEDAGMVRAYLSVPTGESLAALHLDLDTNSLTKAAFKSWKEQKIHQEVWTQKQFVDYTKSMMELGQIKDPETFQQGKKAPEKLSLHLAPFKQGMLYVGSTTTLSQEQIELVQSLADAFAEAYARYEDFNQLEDAKAEVENTLTDLKSAQSQLIQSEKMASLGELTAGIAHEIQNPLNFVTNFSEVSEEMLEELAEEIKNNSESAIEEIITDIKQNLNKINHHGKRASSIVKGMLDHSRTSSGVKELTDINVLADEYLRLAYHGLRAKDKSFQAEFTMDLDRSIPEISIVPQDFGRVILNLINNAFYTVNKKGKGEVNGYKPTVSVSTGKIEGAIKISIKDNGEGISREIADKIFQPFFTTKPTGEGTGLGLSLAYDIITKGHGGTLTVDSKKGAYTEFIIELPVKSKNE